MDKGLFALAALALASASPVDAVADLVPDSATAGIERQKGKRVTGLIGAFNVDFLAVGQNAVTGMVRVILGDRRYLGRPGFEKPVDFVMFPLFHYRWRYMDMFPEGERGDAGWKMCAMRPFGDDSFATITEIEVPGHECDLEFYFTGIPKSPYYQYVDYTGRGTPVSRSGYTEDVSKLRTYTMRMRSGDILQSGGKDWFSRVRLGVSEHSVITVK